MTTTIRRLVVATALTVTSITGLFVSSPVADAQYSSNTVCTPYTSTSGACMTEWWSGGIRHVTLSFYWGNSYVDYQII